MNYLQQEEIKVMDWPAQSPDLKMFERLLERGHRQEICQFKIICGIY